MSTVVVPPALPDKLWELGLIALDDLDAVEADNAYRVHMEYWHVPGCTFCSVCFAGAVMAKSLKTSPDALLGPYDFEEPLKGKLEAIHFLKAGKVNLALQSLGSVIRLPEELDRDFERSVVPYDKDKDAFKDTVSRIVDYCRENDL